MSINSFESRRIKISALIEAGISLKKISEILVVSYSTVKKVAARYKSTGSVERKKGSGRPKVLSDKENGIILEKISKNPKISATKLRNDLIDTVGKDVSSETIRRILHDNNLSSCVAVVKPLLTQSHIDRRFELAKRWIMKPLDYFKSVIFRLTNPITTNLWKY